MGVKQDAQIVVKGDQTTILKSKAINLLPTKASTFPRCYPFVFVVVKAHHFKII